MELFYYSLQKKICLLLTLVTFFSYSAAQIIVEVIADQPEKLEIIVNDEPFTQTDTSVIFGDKLSITGGVEPYSFSWMKDGELVDTDPLLEVGAPLGNEVYSLIVRDANNCTEKIFLTHDKPYLSLPDPIRVFPVPASRFIVIQPANINAVLDITILNDQGMVMMKKQITGESVLDIDFPPGLYFIKAESSERTFVALKKIIVL